MLTITKVTSNLTEHGTIDGLPTSEVIASAERGLDGVQKLRAIFDTLPGDEWRNAAGHRVRTSEQGSVRTSYHWGVTD